MASRTSILETLRYVTKQSPELKPKSTISSFALFFFDLKSSIVSHPIWTTIFGVTLGVPMVLFARRRFLRSRRSGGGFFRLDEKNGLLGGFGGGAGQGNGKAD